MRRFVAFILLCLLPLGWSSAMAAAYCQHEKAPDAQTHFGHHASVTGAGGESDNASGKSDSNCPTCHFFCLKIIACIQAAPLVKQVAPRYVWARENTSRHPPDRLYRPPLIAGF